MASDFPDGWHDALGESIPEEHVAFAAEKARDMGVDGALSDLKRWVRGIGIAVEQDDPSVALEGACERLDYTGACRLLAYLCVGPAGEGGGDAPGASRALSERLRAAADSLDDARDALEYGDPDADAFPAAQRDLAESVVEQADGTIGDVETELRQMAVLAEAHERVPESGGDADGA